MKLVLRFGSALMAAAVLAAPGVAGPHVGGVLYVHTDDAVVYTVDQASYCSPFANLECPDEIPCPYPNPCDNTPLRFNPTSGRGLEVPVVFWVIAAFRDGPSDPCARLQAVNFAITYDMYNDPDEGGASDTEGLVISKWGHCGDSSFEGSVPRPWPEPGSSINIVWPTNGPQRSPLTEVMWMLAYAYSAETLALTFNQGQQIGFFADDSVPSILDPISAYPSIGFGGAAGANPEEPTPTAEQTWGQIKATYAR